jgi:hypothetical protein
MSVKIGLSLFPATGEQRLRPREISELASIGFALQEMRGMPDERGLRLEVTIGKEPRAWDAFRIICERLEQTRPTWKDLNLHVEFLISRPVDDMMFNLEIPRDILSHLAGLSCDFAISSGVMSRLGE